MKDKQYLTYREKSPGMAKPRSLVKTKPVLVVDTDRTGYPFYISLCNQGRNKEGQPVFIPCNDERNILADRVKEWTNEMVENILFVQEHLVVNELAANGVIPGGQLKAGANHPQVVRTIQQRLKKTYQLYPFFTTDAAWYIRQVTEDNHIYTRVYPVHDSFQGFAFDFISTTQGFSIIKRIANGGTFYSDYFLLRGTDLVPIDYNQGRLFREVPDHVSAEAAVEWLNRIHKAPGQNEVTLNGQPFPAEKLPPTVIFFLERLLDTYLSISLRFCYGAEEWSYADGNSYCTHNGSVTVTERDQDAEDKALLFFRQLHPSFNLQKESANILCTDKELPQLVAVIQKRIIDKGYESRLSPDLPDISLAATEPRMKIISSGQQDWFDLDVRCLWDDVEVSAADLLQVVRSGENEMWVGKKLLFISPDLRGRLLDLFSLGELQDGNLRVNAKCLMGLETFKEELPHGLLGKLTELREKLGTDGKQEVQVPAMMNSTLRPYQLDGLGWLQQMAQLSWGACLADDMGLGKTLQVLAFIQWLKESNTEHKSVLLIAPTSLIYNWMSEINKHCPGLSGALFYGSGRNLEDCLASDIVISSYGTARNEISQLEKKEWDYVILDESQMIRNPGSQVNMAVNRLQAKNRIILSGTPVQNRLDDLFAQLDFLNPGFGSFLKKRAEELPQPEVWLRAVLRPFILRRTKNMVARDLPEKTETILWCEMSREQKEVYERIRKQFVEDKLGEMDEHLLREKRMEVLAGITRLRQVCDAPEMVEEGSAEMPSGKLTVLFEEILANTGSAKVLVFSQFTTMLEIIRKEMDKQGISYCYLDGKTTAGARKKQVDEFEQNPDKKAFLISLMAGGTGLNLTSAEYVVLVDPWWNPAVENQAIDRCYRIGQQKNVMAYRLICKDTIEEKMLGLKAFKQSISENIIEADTASANLTLETLQLLFADEVPARKQSAEV